MPFTKSYYKVIRVLPEPDYFYIKNEYSGSQNIGFNITGTLDATDLAYSKDKSTWTLLTSTTSVQLLTGEKVYLRSSTGLSTSSGKFLHISSSYDISVGGKIATLFDYTDPDSVTSIPEYGLYWFLSGKPNPNVGGDTVQSNLISVDNLSFGNITTISKNGLAGTFQGAKFLNAPDTSRFTTIGQLGLENTFLYCQNIVSPPDFSSITSVGKYGCYNTFRYCTSLTTGADLTSCTGVDISYNNNAFSGMYSLCSSLNLAIAPNITSSDYNFNNWLSDVAASGIVKKPTNLTLPTDSTSGIPTGWTTQNY